MLNATKRWKDCFTFMRSFIENCITLYKTGKIVDLMNNSALNKEQ